MNLVPLSLLAFATWGFQTPELRIELVGNAGVVVSDGQNTLLVDLPYEPGAFGYMRYDPSRLVFDGPVTSVVTHHHRDHFDPSLFLERPDWRIVGPASVVASLPPGRVLAGDSVALGRFSIVAIASPHTPDHRSYRVRWNGRVLHFVGDTEDPASVPAEPVDVLFITPWLSCRLEAAGGAFGVRSIAYHLQPDGSDRRCGPVEDPGQGAVVVLSGAGRAGDGAMAADVGTPAEILAPVGGSFVAIQVADAEGAAAWYAETFGLAEVNRIQTEDGAFDIRILSNAGLTVEVIRSRETAPRPDAVQHGFFKAGFYVNDLNVALRWLESRGVAIGTTVFVDAALNARSFVFQDPYGNRLQLFERCRTTC